MPGAYTHLSIASLLVSGNTLKRKSMPEARIALMSYPEFCHMGSLGPDYPYLNINDTPSEHWANAMHHKYPTSIKKNMIHVGVEQLKRMTGDKQAKCIAWFFGYVSHIVADVTCHPMTNLLVGDYEADNQVAHRESELHQDVYIYRTRLDGDVSRSELIKNVIGSCTDTDSQKVDSDVATFWNGLLIKSFPEIHARQPVDVNEWHSDVLFFIDNIAEEIALLPSRHIRHAATALGIAYPRFEEVDTARFIDKLKTPNGYKTYDQVFDRAKGNVLKVWKILSDGIFRDDDSYKEKLNIWNLDSGQIVQTPKIMWKGQL